MLMSVTPTPLHPLPWQGVSHYAIIQRRICICMCVFTHSLAFYVNEQSAAQPSLRWRLCLLLLLLLLLCRCIGGHSYCGDDDGVMMFPHSKTDCPAYSQLGVVCKCERV